MNKQIQSWLEGSHDFKNGVALFQTFGSNATLLCWYKMGDNKASAKSLYDELYKLSILTNYENNDRPAINNPKQSVYGKINPSDLADAPIEIKELVKKRISLHNHRRDAHARLRMMAEKEPMFSNEERGNLAEEILKISDEIEQIWIHTNYWDMHKITLPHKEDTDMIVIANLEKSEIELMRELQNLRSKISKVKCGRLKGDLPALEKLKDELERALE